MPVIANNLSDAPAEFNDGHHAFNEIGLNLEYRKVLEHMEQDEMDVIFNVLKRRKSIMEGGTVVPLETCAGVVPEPTEGKKRGKSSA